MKFLVTGSAGFLGSNFTLKLLQMGHDVVGIDNLSSGFQENLDFHTKEYFGKLLAVDPENKNAQDEIKKLTK
jgi:nucleoside-diphosphate-sugar epimerase